MEISPVKCMDRKIPVINWITRHMPKREPAFHHLEMLEGAGKSFRALFAIFINGWDVRMGIIIYVFLVDRIEDFFEKHTDSTTINVSRRNNMVKMEVKID